MSKKILIIGGIVLIIVVLEIFIFYHFNTSDYEKAERESIKFLNNNIDELQNFSDEIITNKSKNNGNYKNKVCSYHRTSNSVYYVQFDIDLQGIQGGQYWGLIYCPTNNLLKNNSNIEIINQNETGEGNNIFIKKKIQDKWYFYYDDYDGQVDVNSIN